METYIGMIYLWPAPWVPAGFVLCDGRQLSIQTYTALYAIIGVRYGGNATTNFNVPDLRNRFPIGQATVSATPTPGGLSQTTVTVNSTGSLSLSTANLPAHNHAYATPSASATVNIAIPVTATGAGNANVPGTNTVLGVSVYNDGGGDQPVNTYTNQPSTTTLAPFNANVTIPAGATTNTANTGTGTAASLAVTGSTLVATVPPFCPVNYMIAVEGLFPPRN